MRSTLAVGMFLVVGLVPGGAARAEAAGPVVRFATTLGNIDVQLLSDDAPATVANFMGYVNRGDFNGTFFHRSVSGFVIQGGGFRFSGGQPVAIPSQPPVVNEFKVSNTRGTLAMAKFGGDPNSATNQWFFNESDANAANLDAQNGGFTAFGRIVDSAGLNVMDAIASQRIVNASAAFGATFNELPTFNYPAGTAPGAENLVMVNSITVLSDASAADTTSPTIVAHRPRDNERFTQGQPVRPDYSCDDGNGSGVAVCSAPYAVDTDNVGAHKFTITATDRAGNTSTQNVTYYVDPPAPSTPATAAPVALPPAGTIPQFASIAPSTAIPTAPRLTGPVATSARGVVSLVLRCPGPARCRGRVRLVASRRAGRNKQIAVGSRVYSIAKGRTGRLELRLNATGRRLLARGRGRLAVVMTITPRETGAKAVPRKLTLRSKRTR